MRGEMEMGGCRWECGSSGLGDRGNGGGWKCGEEVKVVVVCLVVGGGVAGWLAGRVNAMVEEECGGRGEGDGEGERD